MYVVKHWIKSGVAPLTLELFRTQLHAALSNLI